MICGAGKQIADRWVKEVKKTQFTKNFGPTCARKYCSTFNGRKCQEILIQFRARRRAPLLVYHSSSSWMVAAPPRVSRLAAIPPP